MSLAHVVGSVCNLVVGAALGTVATVEIFQPVQAITGVYKGLPASWVEAPGAGAKLARHLIGVMGSLHLAFAVLLFLSVQMDHKSRQAVSVGTAIALTLHVAALFRESAYEGMQVTPATLPTFPLVRYRHKCWLRSGRRR